MGIKINPVHYKIGGIETIDYIEAKLTREQFIGYLVGNVVKYVSRFEYKNGLEDLKKADWYLNRLIKKYSKPL
jgi:hypothetical protein